MEVPRVRMPVLRSSSDLHELLHHQEEVIAATHHEKPRQRITSLHSSSNINAEAKIVTNKASILPPKPPSPEPAVVVPREWVDFQIALLISEPILLALEKLLNRQEARFGTNMFLEMADNDRPDIERLMSLNYQFEEAALAKFNRLRGLVIPAPGELLQKMDSKSRQSCYGGLRRVDSMAADRLTSSAFAQQQHRLHERHMQCLANLSETEQLRLSLLLSKQEMQHGVNMFEDMTEADEVEIDTQLQRGSRYEDIAYHLFQLKYATRSEHALSTVNTSHHPSTLSRSHSWTAPPAAPHNRPSPMNRSSQSFYGDLQYGHSAMHESSHQQQTRRHARPQSMSAMPAPMTRSGQSFYGDLQHGHSAHHDESIQQEVRPASLSRSPSSYDGHIVARRPAPLNRSGESFYGDLQHGHSVHAAAEGQAVLTRSNSVSRLSNDNHRPAPLTRSGESFYGDLEHGHSTHEQAAQQPKQELPKPPAIITRLSPQSVDAQSFFEQKPSYVDEPQRQQEKLQRVASFSSTSGNGLPPTPCSASKSLIRSNSSMSAKDGNVVTQQQQQHRMIVENRAAASYAGIASPREQALMSLRSNSSSGRW